MSIPAISQTPSILLPLTQKTAQPVAVTVDPDHDGDVDGAGSDNDLGKHVNKKV